MELESTNARHDDKQEQEARVSARMARIRRFHLVCGCMREDLSLASTLNACKRIWWIRVCVCSKCRAVAFRMADASGIYTHIHIAVSSFRGRGSNGFKQIDFLLWWCGVSFKQMAKVITVIIL